MLLDDDSKILQRSKKLTDRYAELEKAVRFAISEVKPVHHDDLYVIWLSFNYKRNKNVRITPLVTVFLKEQCDPNTVELNMNDIYRQVDERFKQETSHGNKVDWDSLILDTYKSRLWLSY